MSQNKSMVPRQCLTTLYNKQESQYFQNPTFYNPKPLIQALFTHGTKRLKSQHLLKSHNLDTPCFVFAVLPCFNAPPQCAKCV